MIIGAIALYALAGLIVAAINIYLQLFIADNWPPRNWKCLQWDAIAAILTVCVLIWWIVLILMVIDSTYQQFLQKRAQKNAQKQAAG